MLTVAIVVEANYSVALMLLLKYPSPEPPNGPYTFVDDAIYLRDNFSVAGGAKIISKYSRRTPPLLSGSRPTTPLGQAVSPRQKLARTKSPLPSPARFLQQQGGIEALFQGATKGVFERGERLGINQAVRDAVGEVKKNMQGIQASRANSTSRRASDVMRWSLDEGRATPPSKVSMTAVNNRNKQLARMLDQAMTDLRAVSVSEDGDKGKYIRAMDLAIAKVDFVKIYLEDSTMPLPTEPSDDAPQADSSPPAAPTRLLPPLDPSPSLPPTPTPDSETAKKTVTAADSPLPSTPIPEPVLKVQKPQIDNSPTTVPSIVSDIAEDKVQSATESGLSARPRAPVPTRSTIAQSSFSWMLEPDSTPPSASGKSSPPKSSSPFLKSGRRPTAGPGREKAAFLFGDDGGETPLTNTRLASLIDADEGFKLGTIRSKDE